MWPSKKHKGPTLPPEKSLEIGLGVEWKKDKDEVVIITEKEKFVLNGNNKLFLEVTSSNADSIKLQIVPDFKKRVIDIVEVIDIAAKQTTDNNKGKILFAGVSSPKGETVPIGELLKKWDDIIELLDKRIHKYRKRRNAFILFGIAVAIGNIYLFIVEKSPMRYMSAIVAVVIMYTSFNLWKSFREMTEMHEKLKKQRLQAFEVAKNK